MNKEIVDQVQEKINTSTWQAEYCHPHKWKDEDMDKCLSVLEHTLFGVDDVVNSINDWSEHIRAVSEDNDVPIVEACVIVIADTLAWSVLNDEDVYFPDSAIFRLHSIS